MRRAIHPERGVATFVLRVEKKFLSRVFGPTAMLREKVIVECLGIVARLLT
jgi:hypothetical protein